MLLLLPEGEYGRVAVEYEAARSQREQVDAVGSSKGFPHAA